MGRLRHSKLILFIIVSLSTIISVSACSLAIPDFEYISNIALTEDSNKVLITVQNSDFNQWKLTYDLSTNELQEVDRELDGIDLEPNVSPQDFVSNLEHHVEGLEWVLSMTDGTEIFDTILSINTTSEIDLTESNVFFVSESLQIAYLILPVDLEMTDNPTAGVVKSTIIIVPFDNPQSYKMVFEAHSYLQNLKYIYFNVYDEFQLLRIQGNGADCVNSIYFIYDSESFEFLVQSFAADRDRIDPRIGKLIISSYGWESQISEITLYNLETGEIENHSISDYKIREVLAIEETESTLPKPTISEEITATLPIFTVATSISMLLIIVIVRNKN